MVGHAFQNAGKKTVSFTTIQVDIPGSRIGMEKRASTLQ
jgi:hypothetical protein